MEENQPKEKRGPGNPAWVKGGESPNPLGRGAAEATGYQDPKTRFKYLAQKYTVEELEKLIADKSLWNKLPLIDAGMMKILDGYVSGNPDMVKIALDRILGRPITPFEVTGRDGKDFSFDGKVIIEHVTLKKSDDDEKIS